MFSSAFKLHFICEKGCHALKVADHLVGGRHLLTSVHMRKTKFPLSKLQQKGPI